jgi:hypothetical protein
MLVGRTSPRLCPVPCRCSVARTYAKSTASDKGKQKNKKTWRISRAWKKKADEKFRHFMDSMVGNLREEAEKGGHMDKFFCCHSFTKAVEENHAACLTYLYVSLLPLPPDIEAQTLAYLPILISSSFSPSTSDYPKQIIPKDTQLSTWPLH